MLNNEFLNSICSMSVYDKKQGTSTAYMRVEGSSLLPKTITLIDRNGAPIKNTGRGAKPRVKQLKSYFTLKEQSPYMMNKPYRVVTSVYEIEGHQRFFSGTIGIPNAEGKIKDIGDLLIIATDNWESLQVAIFKGLAKDQLIGEALQAAVRYLKQVKHI